MTTSQQRASFGYRHPMISSAFWSAAVVAAIVLWFDSGSTDGGSVVPILVLFCGPAAFFGFLWGMFKSGIREYPGPVLVRVVNQPRFQPDGH